MTEPSDLLKSKEPFSRAKAMASWKEAWTRIQKDNRLVVPQRGLWDTNFLPSLSRCSTAGIASSPNLSWYGESGWVVQDLQSEPSKLHTSSSPVGSPRNKNWMPRGKTKNKSTYMLHSPTMRDSRTPREIPSPPVGMFTHHILHR